MSDAVVNIPQAIELIKRQLALDDPALKGLRAAKAAREMMGLTTEPMPTLTTAICELLEEMGLGVRLKGACVNHHALTTAPSRPYHNQWRPFAWHPVQESTHSPKYQLLWAS